MARTTATNFSGGLQFSLASAATDLFKKEDVQVLALAVDGHDHSTGKGLPLASGVITSAMIADGTIVAGDLADGAVTSAKILDGTIATADLAAHAITQSGSAIGVTSSPTTTSGSLVDLTDMTVTLTNVAAGSELVLLATAYFQNSVATAFVQLAANLDGVDSSLNLANVQCPTAGGFAFAAITYRWTGAAAGSRTVKLRWSTNAGTATAYGTNRTMLVMELRR